MFRGSIGCTSFIICCQSAVQFRTKTCEDLLYIFYGMFLLNVENVFMNLTLYDCNVVMILLLLFFRKNSRSYSPLVSDRYLSWRRSLQNQRHTVIAWQNTSVSLSRQMMILNEPKGVLK